MKIPSKSFTAFESKDFSIRVEYVDKIVILHFREVKKFTKDTFLLMKKRLKEYNEFLTSLGVIGIFVALDPSNLKTIRLISLLGFEYIKDNDGVSVFVYKGE